MSVATLLVTEPDFPLGRSVFEQEVPPVGSDQPQTYTPKFAPSSRFIELANIYAELVTGDDVRELMLRGRADPRRRRGHSARGDERLGCARFRCSAIRGLASTPEGAISVAQRANDAFRRSSSTEQDRGGIPADQRVVLTEVRQPSPATTVLLEGRSKTVPIVVFLTVMLAVVGLAFILENLRPARPPGGRRVRARSAASAARAATPLRLGPCGSSRQRRARAVHLVRGRPRGARAPDADRPHGVRGRSRRRPVIALVIVFAVAYRSLLAWDSLLALLVLVILFVPIQRYVLPGSLPFELEPYRLLVAFMIAGWIASLLVDPTGAPAAHRASSFPWS